MSVIAKWNNHKFEVSANIIRSFTDLTIKGSSATEDKGKTDKYVKRKEGKPFEVTFLIKLDKRMGVSDVRKEAMAYISEARKGSKDYITFNGTKLNTFKYMLTDAEASKVDILQTGEWIYCDVKVTFKCASKSTGSSGSKSKKKSSSSKKKKTGSAKTAGSESKTSSTSASNTTSSSKQQIKQIRGAGRYKTYIPGR